MSVYDDEQIEYLKSQMSTMEYVELKRREGCPDPWAAAAGRGETMFDSLIDITKSLQEQLEESQRELKILKSALIDVLHSGETSRRELYHEICNKCRSLSAEIKDE